MIMFGYFKVKWLFPAYPYQQFAYINSLLYCLISHKQIRDSNFANKGALHSLWAVKMRGLQTNRHSSFHHLLLLFLVLLRCELPAISHGKMRCNLRGVFFFNSRPLFWHCLLPLRFHCPAGMFPDPRRSGSSSLQGVLYRADVCHVHW